MTYRLVVRRQAKADIREAARWYERQRAGLGRAFVQQIDALLDRVRLNPMQYQIVYREVRRAIPRRFPYGVFYRINPNHPSLRFKQVHATQPIYSGTRRARTPRACIIDGETVVWFWIGTHSEYGRLLRAL